MLAYRPGTLGVDINPHTIEYCRSLGLPASQMAVDHVPHADQAFDSVLLDNVLEHIADPRMILSEVHRVLRPGGRLVVGVPGRKGWDSDSDHKVFYDETTLRATIEGKGFAWEESFFTPLWESEWLGRVVRPYCVYGVFGRRE
jgi:SAM-dependent methyltransferase